MLRGGRSLSPNVAPTATCGTFQCIITQLVSDLERAPGSEGRGTVRDLCWNDDGGGDVGKKNHGPFLESGGKRDMSANLSYPAWYICEQPLLLDN